MTCTSKTLPLPLGSECVLAIQILVVCEQNDHALTIRQLPSKSLSLFSHSRCLARLACATATVVGWWWVLLRTTVLLQGRKPLALTPRPQIPNPSPKSATSLVLIIFFPQYYIILYCTIINVYYIILLYCYTFTIVSPCLVQFSIILYCIVLLVIWNWTIL